jgi:two-component sensor histidine kinase
LETIDVNALLQSLSHQLQQAYSGKVDFIAGPPLVVNTQIASTLAVIVNELMTNAMKHANCRVRLVCASSAGNLQVTVSDDGPGLPNDFSFKKTNRFGLNTNLLLAETIGGRLEALRNRPIGAAIRLTVPLARPKESSNH